MNNEIKINVPERMEIDKENSTFECIKFKPKWIPKRGDIAFVGSSQMVLVEKYLKAQETIGFCVVPLAVLTDDLVSIKNNYLGSLWVLREASTSEKELFIEKLNEQGYVYDPNDPRVIYKKERELPKTWEEFCENNPIIKSNEYFVSTSSDIARGNSFRASQVRNKDIDGNLLPSKQYAEAMLALCKLIQLRDCYNDGWEPDWNNSETKYAIHTRCNGLDISTVGNVGFVLTFKTEELSCTFLNNFKDLIEQAKLLL